MIKQLNYLAPYHFSPISKSNLILIAYGKNIHIAEAWFYLFIVLLPYLGTRPGNENEVDLTTEK